MMKYIEKLKKYGKKTISKMDMETVFATSSDEELFEIISVLSEQQILFPIKSSKTNGNRLYPIYLKYKVSLPQDTYESELKEISALHPLLQSNGYLQSKPEEYKKYRLQLQKLDRYLFYRSENEISISRKERSFEIFDEEKALDDKTFCALLERIGITPNELAFYDTPEYCFNDYIPDRKAHKAVSYSRRPTSHGNAERKQKSEVFQGFLRNSEKRRNAGKCCLFAPICKNFGQ